MTFTLQERRPKPPAPVEVGVADSLLAAREAAQREARERERTINVLDERGIVVASAYPGGTIVPAHIDGHIVKGLMLNG